MKKQIVINASKDRSRIAIVENDELVELYVENPDNVRTIGNVYLGRVQKVMPAIRAAFVDVGQKQDCFLHFSDLTDNLPQLLALAGEDVPGLNEPVLSLAPAKRVADDENEPDVEDALEVEAAEPESSTKSRSRRRSRGRGRSRRGRSRREEEEEQEEQGPRRLPGVIDLSSPARRPTRRPDPEPEDDDLGAQADEPPAEEAPKPTRSRKKKAEADPDADPDADPAEEAPKKARSRKKKADDADDAPNETEADATDDAPDEPDTAADADAEAAAPKKKRRRRRGGRGGSTSDADDSDDATSASDAAPETEAAPKPTRSRKKKAEADPDADPAEEAPKKARSRKKKADDSDDASEETPKPSRSRKKKSDDRSNNGSEPGDVSPTGRSRRPENPATADLDGDTAADDAPSGDADDTDSQNKGGAKRLPATLDLTSSSKPSRSRRSADTDDDSDDETETSGRGRRRGRGGRASESDDRTADAEASDDSGDDASRSRRGRRASSDDTEGRSRRGGRSSSDDTESDGDEDGSRSRRSRGGRSSDSDNGSDAAGEDEKGGDRRGRSGRSNDRSGDRSSGRSSRSGRSADRSSGRSNGNQKGGSQKNGPIPPNEELLRRSGKIIVKITKEAISTKGPRVSTDLSLAGRFLVLVPAADYVAVSKKIESAKERRRLRTLATSLKPDRFGVIVRTVAEGRDAKSLDTDLRLLVEKWRKIEAKLNENPEPPVLLYQDVNMVSSVIRDLFSEDYDRILVDDPKVYKNVQAYVKAVAPQMADKVELHSGRSPVFRSLGIEKQVEEAFSKRVNMRGGGYLFIETTEAMHVVDVNSGRAGRGKSQKQNLIDVNVEAAREVAKQLRLRDLGGIIVVDFIDLRYDRDRKKVTDVLKQEFAKDRAVTKLLPMSDFGLVQITRQRLRPSITANAIDEDGNPLDAAEAAEAAGAGEIRRRGQTAEPEPAPEPAAERPERSERPPLSPEDSSPSALTGSLRGWLDHYRQTVDEKYKRRPIVVRVHPLFASYLRRGFPSPLMRWNLSLRGITFRLEEDATVDPLTFDVRDQKSGRTLLKKYSV